MVCLQGQNDGTEVGSCVPKRIHYWQLYKWWLESNDMIYFLISSHSTSTKLRKKFLKSLNNIYRIAKGTKEKVHSEDSAMLQRWLLKKFLIYFWKARFIMEMVVFSKKELEIHFFSLRRCFIAKNGCEMRIFIYLQQLLLQKTMQKKIVHVSAIPYYYHT